MAKNVDKAEQTNSELNIETPDYMIRVIDEAKVLKSKLDRLVKFITSEDFSDLELCEQKLLKVQSEHMNKYLEVLHMRIGYHVCKNK